MHRWGGDGVWVMERWGRDGMWAMGMGAIGRWGRDGMGAMDGMEGWEGRWGM